MSGSSTGSADSAAGAHAVGVVDDRERLTPVPLPGEQPVAQLVLDASLRAASAARRSVMASFADATLSPLR